MASGPGTGKTSRCIELFKEEILKSKGGIDSRSFFVLPSREHAERIQNLILRKDVRGLFNAHIVTINDLAARLSGVPAVPPPPEALRQKIIREILGSSLDFKYFEPSKELPGFHRLCSDLIKEFKTGLLSVGEFERRAQPLLKDPVFRSKFRDFTVLVKNYDRRLAEAGFTEPEDTIACLAAQKIGPAVDLAVFDGFYHFSRAQGELIRALSRVSKRLLVTLTAPAEPGERPDLFYYPERTRAFLLSLGFRQTKGAFKVNRRTKNPAIVHLEAQLFSKNPRRYAGLPEGLAVLEAPGMRGEIEGIAREIRRLLREEPVYLSDICVLLRSVSPYQKVIASVFGKFGIPVHIHERYKLKETALASFLYRFLNLSAAGWKREDLFYVLKSGFYASRVPLEDALDFERTAVWLGISEGRPAWFALAEKEAPEAVKRLLRELAEVEDALSAARDARVFAAALRRFIRALQPADPAAEKAIDEILRNIERLDRPSAGAVVEFQTLVESALFSVKPRGKNRVQVYDVVMALPKEYKVIFVAGLLERVFPQHVTEDPLFKDEERRVINQKGIVLEERRPRAAGERYFFYMALTRAREKIYLTYPLFDAEGRPRLTSFFVEETRKCFEREIPTRSRDLSDFLPEPAEWETEKEVTRGLADILGNPLSGAGAKEAAKTALPDRMARADFGEILEWMNRPELHAAIRDPRIRRALAEKGAPYSATRLEAMAACAFRHFASEILKLEEPPEGREAMEMGTALHKTLEAYFKSLTAQARKTGSYVRDAERLKKELKTLLLPIAAKSPLSRGKPYRFRMQLESMRKSLELFAEAEKELFEKRGFAASKFELRFGDGRKSGPGFLGIPAGSETISIRGQIDRLDVSPDGKSALVTDYKLSKRPSVHGKLKEGLELQLPVYLLAARRLLGFDVIGAEHRYLKEPGRQGIYREDARESLGLGPRETVYTPEEFETVLSETEERIRRLTGRIREADIAVRSKSCTFCHFSPVCRFEPWQLAAQDKAPS